MTKVVRPQCLALAAVYPSEFTGLLESVIQAGSGQSDATRADEEG